MAPPLPPVPKDPAPIENVPPAHPVKASASKAIFAMVFMVTSLCMQFLLDVEAMGWFADHRLLKPVVSNTSIEKEGAERVQLIG